jgi:peptidyl-prolyl cis-trans isomerase D
MSKQGGTPVTKKHHARVERERLQRRWIIGGTIALTLILVGILGYGWLDQSYLKPHSKVADVNGEKITAMAVEARFKLAQDNLVSQQQRISQFMQVFADNPSIQSSFTQQLQQIQAQLANPTALRQTVLDQMVDDLLIRQESIRRGISVTPTEVRKAIEDAFGFFPNGTSTPAATLTPYLTFTPTASLTPTAGPSPTGTPTSTSTATLEPTGTPTAGPSPTITPTSPPEPTPTAYTTQAFGGDYQKYIASLAKISVSEADFQAQFEAQLYRDRLQKAFEATVPHSEEQVHARHILLKDEATAQLVLDQLKAGKTWEDLAKATSLDTSNKDSGGDLGWFGRGAMVKEFEDAAFAAKVGITVGPIKTTYGFHLIQVLGHETRQLDPTAYQAAVQKAFSDWLSTAHSAKGVVYTVNWEALMPVEPTPQAATQ